MAPDGQARRLGLSSRTGGSPREPRTAAGWTPQTPPRPTQLSPYAPQPAPVSAGPPDAPPHLQSRNPVDRLTRGLPPKLRVTIDWAVTIVGAVAIVLLVKAFVVNPYRIPSSSMEPTLHCAAPAIGCEARFSDRVLANRFIYHLRDPRRGEIIVFKTPPEAQIKCGAGGTFVKRLIGLPGDTRRGAPTRRQRLRLHQREAAERAVHPARPARDGAGVRTGQGEARRTTS